MSHANVNVSELFAEYEADFHRLLAEADEFLAASCASAAALGKADRRLTEADQAVKQMDLEVRALPPEARQKLQEKIKGFKASVSERRKQKEGRGHEPVHDGRLAKAARGQANSPGFRADWAGRHGRPTAPA
ncbi:unnamed protein product [Cladocopium goreaui]|uniref:Vesicle transport through interaction with t-SNAREs-like 1A n=1 Tax=Cladocopium goreaui TaxID=2562237 RepID=A0A9P1FJP3_9DINO|nr:unnamed protein product [Cladocopium goreaui]